MLLIQNILQLCGMLAVLFGGIYLSFSKAPLPFTVNFNVDGSRAIGLFGMVGSSLIGVGRYVWGMFHKRPAVQTVVVGP